MTTLPTLDLSPRQAEILKDAALAVHGHGFGDEFGDMADTDGWNGLAYVSGVVLDNIGEHDLASDYRTHIPYHSAQVWVRTVSNGQTYIRTSAWVDSPQEQTLLRTWDALAG